MENSLNLQLLFVMCIFLSTVFMNIVKKNTHLAIAYLLQSVTIVLMLGMQAVQESSIELFFITLCMFIIKVIIAPQMFIQFVKTKQLNFTASTYLNVPTTLIVIVFLTFFAQSEVFSSFSHIISAVPQFRVLLLGTIFASLFLVVNRKGILSQMIGILALENGIFALGKFLDIKQTAALELGILFDIFFWIVISIIFARMIHEHYRSMDTTELNRLKK